MNSRKTEIPRNEKEFENKPDFMGHCTKLHLYLHTYHCKTAVYLDFFPNLKHMHCNIYCFFGSLAQTSQTLGTPEVHHTAEKHGLSPYIYILLSHPIYKQCIKQSYSIGQRSDDKPSSVGIWIHVLCQPLDGCWLKNRGPAFVNATAERVTGCSGKSITLRLKSLYPAK